MRNLFFVRFFTTKYKGSNDKEIENELHNCVQKKITSKVYEYFDCRLWDFEPRDP